MYVMKWSFPMLAPIDPQIKMFCSRIAANITNGWAFQSQQLLPANRSRKEINYRSNANHNSNPPVDDYSPYQRRPSHSLERPLQRPSYTRPISRDFNSSTQLRPTILYRDSVTRGVDDGYARPRISPRRSTYDDDRSPSVVDGYLPSRTRRPSPIRAAQVNQRLYSDTPSPPMLTDEDEPMPSAVRQRRLPLIGTLPPATLLRSPEYYSSLYHNPRGDISVGCGGGLASVYFTPTEDIPSPSPSSGRNFPIYGQGGGYGPRLSVGHGWRAPSVATGYYSTIAQHSRVPSDVSSGSGAATVVYAGSRIRPMTRVIRAQPGNVPLSDSDNDEPKWAIV